MDVIQIIEAGFSSERIDVTRQSIITSRLMKQGSI